MTAMPAFGVMEMEAEDEICPSFVNLLRTVQSETRILKYLSQLRSLPSGDDLSAQLHEIESIVGGIEQSLAEFNDFIASETKTCDVLDKEVCELADEQKARIQRLEHTLASVYVIKPIIGEIVREKCGAYLVTKSELEAVPKSTRNRLTVGVISAALSAIIMSRNEKQKVISLPRKKLSRVQLKIIEDLVSYKHPDHGNSVFLTESEIRSTTVFQAGESTGKSIIHTLRAMQKIKLVRSSGENTYVIL